MRNDIVLVFFGSRRYWADGDELQKNFEKIKGMLGVSDCQSLLVTEEKDLELLEHGDCMIAVPMSGAVQSLILNAAGRFRTVILYAAYIKGNTENAAERLMLEKNAAPTLMDSWAVLKRSHAHVTIALNNAELAKWLRIFQAYLTVQGARLLLIGNTEPWVISNSRDRKNYEKLGVKIIQIEQAEVVEQYNRISDEESAVYYNYFKGDEQETIEPTNADLLAAARMSGALMHLLEKYEANGMALACFNLLSTGTNCCLGVSYINDCTPYVASCEGDVDSAVTMLAMKQLCTTKLWMANPGLHPDGVINFSHCTAPLDMFHTGKCPYTLRNHHESGIGTSLQVDYPIGQTVTACRISDDASKMTVQKGVTVSGEYERACRTQVYIKFDDFRHYLDTVLGCHQVFAFEDIEEEMKLLGMQLGLMIL